MEAIKNLQGMRTVYNSNEVDSLDSDNEEMLRGAGSSGCGSGSESGSEGSEEDKFLVSPGSDSVTILENVHFIVDISWGAGSTKYDADNKPAISASLRTYSEPNPDYEYVSESFTVNATWGDNISQVPYLIVLKGKYKCYVKKTLPVQIREFSYRQTYPIPETYRD